VAQLAEARQYPGSVVPEDAGELLAQVRQQYLAWGTTAKADQLDWAYPTLRPAPPALKTLARRSPIPVDLQVYVNERLPEPVEVSAYYIVAEALTNAAKHARASAVGVEAEVVGDLLRVTGPRRRRRRRQPGRGHRPGRPEGPRGGARRPDRPSQPSRGGYQPARGAPLTATNDGVTSR
jgi:hypothetical protein